MAVGIIGVKEGVGLSGGVQCQRSPPWLSQEAPATVAAADSSGRRPRGVARLLGLESTVQFYLQRGTCVCFFTTYL